MGTPDLLAFDEVDVTERAIKRKNRSRPSMTGADVSEVP
jgi:hypothetical protein